MNIPRISPEIHHEIFQILLQNVIISYSSDGSQRLFVNIPPKIPPDIATHTQVFLQKSIEGFHQELIHVFF